ncbi:LysR family transcriptional regulator [Carnimonas bestiolae]|uniref:LysR family transcriptional regulator n=1 Tax=Carnimonas bestiolae TaxID=3402172 RepID=UPI003EDC3C01
MTSDSLPSLTALRAFEATARLGSASAAADALHLTHGAISRQIKALESELKHPLFARHGRRLVLTAEGRAFADSCTQAFDMMKAARRTFERAHEGAPLVLTCTGSLLARWLIPRLPRLNRELPELRLRWVPNDHDSAAATQDIDAQLVFSDNLQAPAKQRVLAVERIGPVLAPQLAAQLGVSATSSADTVLAQPLLHTLSRPQAWPQWARRSAIDEQLLQLGQGFEHLYYLLEAAEAGLGIAIAPQLLVEDAIESGRLIAPWGFVATDATLALISREGLGAREQRHIHELGDWLETTLDSSANPAADRTS